MTIITLRDMRAAGVCPDARLWCAKHGIDWRDFKKNGISVDVLRKTGDNLSKIDRLEAAAKERESNGQ